MSARAKKAVEETLNTKNFTLLIEEFVARTGSDYLDAIIHFAEQPSAVLSHVFFPIVAVDKPKYKAGT